MKNNVDAFIVSQISLSPICAEASQIRLDATIEIASANALAVFSIAQFLCYASEWRIKMNKTMKRWFIIAGFLVVFGFILFMGVMAVYDFYDLEKLSTMKYDTNTYEVNGAFDKISINVDTTQIEFVPSDNESCRIVCFETEKMKHSAIVQDKTLIIDIVDTRKWYDYIGISIGCPKMTVYLPQNEYTSLFIDTHTGDIAIPQYFTFETLKINGNTADVECLASVLNVIEIKLSTGNIKIDSVLAGEIRLASTTGKININSVSSKGNIEIKTTTGAVNLTDATCTDFTAESNTGRISLKNVIASNSFFIENDTGNVRFENSDAAQISIKTSTGDVTGTLLSEKVFITETSTGNISVPKTITGGKCEITTSTGDIKIDIK